MKEIQKLRMKIETVKQQIINLGDMRPGSLTRQTRSWGKEYWQLSYTHRGRGRTGYVSDENYERARFQTENYKKFKEWSIELVDLSIKLANLTDKEPDSK